MFPVSDDNTRVRTLPVVTYSLIALNVLIFLLQLSGGDQFIKDWAFIPSRFSTAPVADAVTIVTASMAAGFTSSATCCFFGSLETTWKTVSAISHSWSSICW